MTSLHEKVAQAALDCFSSQPQKCKPRTAADGREEWTPLAAVVISRGTDDNIIECASLATGTKCLPASALSKCHGTVLHDSHAEILALRGFNRWLLQEIQHMLKEPAFCSPYLRRQDAVDTTAEDVPPFRLASDITLHFFTTEAPCGDASMELLIEAKPPEDTVPWNLDGADISMPGRGYFSLLGSVRRKPARADAEPSLCKSCSDKLAIKQVTSALSFPTDTLVQRTPNAFLSALIVPAGQYNEIGFRRAFGPNGRMKHIADESSRFFDIVQLPDTFPRFEFENRRNPTKATKASNISALYIRDSGQPLEILLNGVKQGFKQFDMDARKQSAVCRKQMWLCGSECVRLMDALALMQPSSTYREAKYCGVRFAAVQRRNVATTQMGRWTPSRGDEDWTLT